MRTTNAFRQQVKANLAKKSDRQSVLGEWNFSANVGRKGPIGLVTKRKESVVAPSQGQRRQLVARSSNKENGASGPAQPKGVATRRNQKAQRKAAQKEIKLVPKVTSGANLDEELGLFTRRNSGLEADLTVETQTNSESTLLQASNELSRPKRRSVMGRKRSFNDLKVTQNQQSGHSMNTEE